MRYLGLDLGTKTLGIAVSDRSNTLSSPLKILRFQSEDYNSTIDELKKIIEEYKITNIALGLPKNMDGSLGFAANRSLEYKKLLEENFNMEIALIDERLTSVSAHNILSNNGKKTISHKDKVDAVAASLILESYIKREENK